MTHLWIFQPSVRTNHMWAERDKQENVLRGRICWLQLPLRFSLTETQILLCGFWPPCVACHCIVHECTVENNPHEMDYLEIFKWEFDVIYRKDWPFLKHSHYQRNIKVKDAWCERQVILRGHWTYYFFGSLIHHICINPKLKYNHKKHT